MDCIGISEALSNAQDNMIVGRSVTVGSGEHTIKIEMSVCFGSQNSCSHRVEVGGQISKMSRPEIVEAFMKAGTRVPEHFLRDPTIKLSNAEIGSVVTREFIKCFFSKPVSQKQQLPSK